MGRYEEFAEHLKSAGIVDPEGTHYEFKRGMHGQKIDFDRIERPSELYDEWVGNTANFIDRFRAALNLSPEAGLFLIFGVANGTNEFALDVADAVPKSVGFETEKDEEGKVQLTRTGRRAIEILNPFMVVFLEDVSTTGSSSVVPATEARALGVQNPLVLTTWQRRPKLEELDNVLMPNAALIYEPLPTFTPDECISREDGFCRRWGDPVPYER